MLGWVPQELLVLLTEIGLVQGRQHAVVLMLAGVLTRRSNCTAPLLFNCSLLIQVKLLVKLVDVR